MKIHEVDRRGFLRGLGAAAMAGAAGSAMAAPFSHGEFTDQMTGKTQGKYSVLRSDNSNAKITIKWPGSTQPGFIIDVPGEVLQLGINGAGGRIKINGELSDIYFNPMVDRGANSSAGVLSDKIARKLLKSNGEVLIEIPVYGKGNKIYKFTVEPDSIVKQLKDPQPKKPEVKKDEPEKQSSNDIRKANLDRMSGYGSPSASYASRLIARIKPNITFSGQVEGNPSAEVEVKAASNGTIVSRRLTSTSGDRAWDEAVLRAIDKTEILPRDTDGRVPNSITITFRPKD